ncbi:MAG: type II toxin-antitoxin system RelE/ParE family toxin [Bacteroidetes bacterium]|nr:type II toxin-antitoxin system RelE/ParE family toxin [Bacteroidota bacterium]
MMYNVILARSFERDVRPLIKKFASLRQELAALGEELQKNPTLGTPLGQNCYKIRLAIKSKGKGKSGGARIITYVLTEDQEVILLTIYDKQVKGNLSDKELKELLNELE